MAIGLSSLISALGGATGVINLFNIELTDAFRTTLLKCTRNHANRLRRFKDIQGGPRKVKPTTILLVTFECVGKIQ